MEPSLAKLLTHRAQNFKVKHKIVLQPSEQYTMYPESWYLFQAGSQWAIVSEFSTHSPDENDIFTDPNIKRMPVVK
jgi:D-lyxose ketol-isomerase